MLWQPLDRLPGVGGARAEQLARLGLRRLVDLLFYFPRDYEELTEVQAASDLVDRQPATIIGYFTDMQLRPLRRGRSVLAALLETTEGLAVRCVWFNQPYRLANLPRNVPVVVTGVVRRVDAHWEMSHPVVRPWSEGEPVASGIMPIYSLTEGLPQWYMRRLMQRVVRRYAGWLEDVLPEEFRRTRKLVDIVQAVQAMHFPEDWRQWHEARRRLAFQELFLLQLAMAWRRKRSEREARAPVLVETPQIRERILRLFPFELTAGQHRAIAEIVADMARPVPMNRLLQGDVGAGKTVVAIYAMLLAVAHRHQAALLAPTEILARQHARKLAETLAHGRVRMALLTGALSARERQETLAAIERGDIDIVVGTHALIHAVEHQGLRFRQLGLVVIDEQHRFGVEQRARMRQAGVDPHYLVMTATPIPRTIAMTLFGDLDLSELRELPPGRQPVYTYCAGEAQRPRWWDFFRKKLRQGRQGYVIVPMVDDQENEQIGVRQAFEALANDTLEEFRLDLLHGRMSGEEKDHVMRKFASGETQVLVCTSVVEVGIDVPNATVMTIEGAERFGLAQLHQLRGRISRGRHPGFLCLFAQNPSPEAAERLEIFRSTTNGFELAEWDLKLRGPGELLGTRQHGIPPLRVADLVRDRELLEEARRDAQLAVDVDPELNHPAWQSLKRVLLHRYGKVLDLADVG
ncbi:MAG: ATP-dependent DNA helicase RecG [Pirellulaceae bacterium]|nr:MAG: ATP-dependent DNA helicase RecG [Pirellulaceae bacterium]